MDGKDSAKLSSHPEILIGFTLYRIISLFRDVIPLSPHTLTAPTHPHILFPFNPSDICKRLFKARKQNLECKLKVTNYFGTLYRYRLYITRYILQDVTCLNKTAVIHTLGGGRGGAAVHYSGTV
jgi:hypothetical protein